GSAPYSAPASRRREKVWNNNPSIGCSFRAPQHSVKSTSLVFSAPHLSQPKCSSNRRRILDAAICPQAIDTTGNGQSGAGPYVSLEDLSIISNMSNDTHNPILGQTELLAIIVLCADKPLHIGLAGFERLFQVPRSHSKFFGIEHCVMSPFDDAE